MFKDPHTDAIWITTGDENSESAIWLTEDDFQTVRQIAGGNQHLRAVQLLFTADHIYWGTDAPEEPNYLYRLYRKNNRLERLVRVVGPVFYGCQISNWLFFATVVEPSKKNRYRQATLLASRDGEKWRVLRRFRKDLLPMRLFQYGQVMFPSGPGDDEHLWFTPFATRHDQRSFRIELSEIERSFYS